MLASLWRKFVLRNTPAQSVNGSRQPAARRSHLQKPRLEVLEDRCLLSTAILEFPTSANTSPYGITAGGDGNLWFTEFNGNRIGAINPTTHAVTEIGVPTGGSGPLGITAGPDGNLWFTEFAGNRIGAINPTTKAIAEVSVPTAAASPLE